MTESQIETRNVELKNKKICRFCLSQNEPLSNIYSRENRLKSSAPLPLQVMACVSIEVFTNDGMPSTICDNCRMLMEHCYRFKQMCKKADNALRQFPLTGVWPPNLELPKVPEELLQKQYPSAFQKSQPEAKTASHPVDVRPTPVKLVKVQQSSAALNQVVQKPTPGRPKLLNKNSNKILNRHAVITSEPILSEPKIKTDDAGNVEIVTEILENYDEPDPIKSAAKVETNVFPCPHCERSFPLRQLLDIHMVNHNRERSFECEHCDKKFFSKYDLGKHMLIHTGEKPYKCVVCNKAFTRSTLLYRHEKVHTDQPKFLCIYCEKPFLSTDELEKHTERHRKNRPFSCKICGKRFAFKQGLERHETVHAKEQPYPCQYCELSFSTPSKLARHLTAHAGDRPFPCKLCPKSYLLSHHLTRHLRSHSQGSGSYKCYDCEKNFTSRDDLIYHSAVHATQTLVCPLCKEHFSDLDLVTEHIKDHAEGEQYACEFCDLIFMTADKLQTHRDAEHTEDLVAYKEHDNNQINVKRESILTFDESSQEMQEGEVIQEFIIEEYHHDNQEDILDNRMIQTIVKEEQDQSHSGSETIKKRLSARSSGGHSDTSSGMGHIKEIKILSTDGTEDEDFDMEIETLERDEDAEYSYASQEEMETPVEPPPTKLRKLSTAVCRREIQEEKPRVLLNNKNLIEDKTKKFRQPSITSVLQHLPKGVTIVKKEKSPKDKKTEVKEIRFINQGRQTAKHESPKQSPETRKMVNVKPKLNEEKPHVEVLKGKSTKSPSSSVSKVETPDKTPKTSPAQPQKKLVEMMIGDKKVKVQKIMMTKAEVAAMAKEGKIEMKGGTMILKQDKGSSKGAVKK